MNTIETTSSNLSKQNFKKESGEDFEVITGDDGHHLANGELQKEKDSSKDATTNTMENANGVNSDNDEQKDYVEVNDSMYSSQGESFITKTVQNNGSNTQNTSQANLLEYLFAFLDTDDELNSVLCGYFNKLVVSLLRRNHKKVRNISVDAEHNSYLNIDDRVCLLQASSTYQLNKTHHATIHCRANFELHCI